MPKHIYENAHPHPAHGWRDVLRWKLGWGPREAPRPAGEKLPAGETPQFPPEPGWLARPDPERVQLTWIGHSTFLIQHRGRNFLTDPVFGDYASPVPVARLRRAMPPGLALPALPPVHEVLISHNHYDHLELASIRKLGSQPNYWLPAGLAGWFHRRGIANSRQLEWWQTAKLTGGLEIHCVPAQHFSARTPFDRNRTHWCGWVIRSSRRTIYFAGDTAYCPVFKEIGARFGGIDLAMIPIGAYRPRWLMQSMHVDPGEAVQIHLDVGSRQSVACHWGTFALTDEPLNEPPLLLARELSQRSIPAEKFRALKFGELVLV